MVHFTVMDFEQLSWENNFISDCSLPIDKFEDEKGDLYYIVRNHFIKEGRQYDNKEFVLKFIIGAFAEELTHGNVVKQRYFTGHSRECDENEPVAVFSAFIDIKKGRAKHRLCDFFEMEKMEGEAIIDFCIRKGMGDDLFLTFILDYICGNLERHIDDFYLYEDESGEYQLIIPTFCKAPQFQNSAVGGTYILTGEDLLLSIKKLNKQAFFCDNFKSNRRLTPKLEMLNNVFNDDEVRDIRQIIRQRFQVLSPFAKVKFINMAHHYLFAIKTSTPAFKLRYLASSVKNKLIAIKRGNHATEPNIHDNVH